jgi:hypothetical protein
MKCDEIQLTNMDDREFGARIAAGIGEPQLWRLRRSTAMTTGRNLSAAGNLLLLAVDFNDAAHKQIIAVSILLRMGGELARASAKLLASCQHYAGAALLRQIVEIEYLTWAFKEKYRDPEKWLESTYEERMKDFSPSQLRKTSKGRFLFKDYHDHCERGGHPVPNGAGLLGGQNKEGAQILLVDLISHCWRTWDHIPKWAVDLPIVQPIITVLSTRIYGPLRKWGDVDPLYAAMVERAPNSEAKA